jgi:rubrerythrin
MRIPHVVGALAPMAGLLLVVGPPVIHAEGMTFPALHVACDREIRTQRTYEASADRAGIEGYFQVRNLFRALAVAEGIHARKLASRIEQMGEIPVPRMERVSVGTTAQNLEEAIVAERFEHTVTYDQFQDYARNELDYEALALFRNTCAAEVTHATKLAEAFVKLDETRQVDAANPVSVQATLDAVKCAPAYFVCTGCGCVCCGASPSQCRCGTSGRHFAVVRDTTVPPPAVLAGL